MASWEPEEGEIPAQAAIAACGTGWSSCGQASLVEAPCNIDSSSGKPIEAMELDTTIYVDPIAAVAPSIQVLLDAIMKPERLH